VWAAVGGVAAGSGPILGGLLADWSWRWIFVINVPLAGGQAQYAEAPVPRQDDDGLAPLLHWAVEHLDQPLTIADMASHQH
jgi:MFS family permease